MVDCLPIVLLLLASLGGMYFGVVTPTEAAAFGCLVALLIAFGYRELTWKGVGDALRNAGRLFASSTSLAIVAVA